MTRHPTRFVVENPLFTTSYEMYCYISVNHKLSNYIDVYKFYRNTKQVFNLVMLFRFASLNLANLTKQYINTSYKI